MGTSALQLIGEAIDALMRADAARLERLGAELLEAAGAQTRQQERAVAEKKRALRHLLVLTRRNLRLLRRAEGPADGYSAGRP